MKLFKIYQTRNTEYDTYDSAVVCAVDEEDAKTISPDGNGKKCKETVDYDDYFERWVSLADVRVEELGEAIEGLQRGVIVASFNAG